MTAHKSGDPTTLNRLYGRSKGKALRAGQQALIEELLPQIAVPSEGPVTAERLFGRPYPLHFEIGFGGGEHLAARADMLPDHGFIGCEPFINGVAQALVHIGGDHGAHPPLGNVRLHHGDALEVLSRVHDGALSFLYLLHPDPWPKARHAKRRMMNDGPVRMFAAKL
jgi:tRNA (guanine-N7-)-methyltransferase